MERLELHRLVAYWVEHRAQQAVQDFRQVVVALQVGHRLKNHWLVDFRFVERRSMEPHFRYLCCLERHYRAVG